MTQASPSAAGRRKRGRPLEPDALFRRIADRLRQRLNAGTWLPGCVLPSLRALAREFGAGPITIRGAVEVLRLEGLLEPGPRGRLMAAAPDGSKRADHQLAVLVASSYLDHYLRTRYGQQVHAGLTLEVTNQGRAFLLAHNYRFLRTVPQGFDALRAEGVLLWGHFLPEVLDAFAAMPYPVVFVDRPPGRWKLHYACVDNEAAACDATRRLAQLGHKRIAFIRQIMMNVRDTDPDTIERQRGYERGLRESGLPVRREHIVNSPVLDTPDSPSIQSLFEGFSRPTAVLAVDGVKARLVADAARARGQALPRDLSLACFQELNPAEAEISGPRTDFAEIGRQAALLLKEPKRSPQVRRVASVWFDGATTAPPRRR